MPKRQHRIPLYLQLVGRHLRKRFIQPGNVLHMAQAAVGVCGVGAHTRALALPFVNGYSATALITKIRSYN